jgi:hypothetical protein
MITLKALQAVTNAPECYDYGWMKTVVANIALDEKGRPCRLVQNDDEWHFRQQLLRYGSGLNLAIADQKRLDEFFQHGWLKLTDKPIRIHRIKVDLHQIVGSDADRRDALLQCLGLWQDDVKYRVGHRTDYYIDCLGDDAAEQLRANLRALDVDFEPWGPQPG